MAMLNTTYVKDLLIRNIKGQEDGPSDQPKNDPRNIFNIIYPIGSIFIAANDKVDINEIFQTYVDDKSLWIRISDEKNGLYLKAVNKIKEDAIKDEKYNNYPNKGEKVELGTLDINNLPPHNHGFGDTEGVPATISLEEHYHDLPQKVPGYKSKIINEVIPHISATKAVGSSQEAKAKGWWRVPTMDYKKNVFFQSITKTKGAKGAGGSSDRIKGTLTGYTTTMIDENGGRINSNNTNNPFKVPVENITPLGIEVAVWVRVR